jgi:hypothetical protein
VYETTANTRDRRLRLAGIVLTGIVALLLFDRFTDGTGMTAGLLVGLLGTDGTTRSMRELVARTYALREEGLSAWCWTGNYELPVRTLAAVAQCVRDRSLGSVSRLAITAHRSRA